MATTKTKKNQDVAMNEVSEMFLVRRLLESTHQPILLSVAALLVVN